MFAGPVEADETYFGRQRKNMLKSKRENLEGCGAVGKTAVVGGQDSDPKQDVASNGKDTLRGLMRDHADPDATVYTGDGTGFGSAGVNTAQVAPSTEDTEVRGLPERSVTNSYRTDFKQYLRARDISPLLLRGHALDVLTALPGASVDCAMTSPPYWMKREYDGGGLGLEPDYRDYVRGLTNIFRALQKVLKPTGSFWLNIGDTYRNKSLVGIPWRVVLEMTDQQGWTLRNSVIWNKVKSGMDNTRDRLGSVHEHLFHFVKQPRGYYYDADAIRSKPREAKIVNGAVVSATGVSGVRYKRQIELSTCLSGREKGDALRELARVLEDVASGKTSDFRMIIRGQQRTTHSDSEKVSGRAKELRDRGFYFLRYHPNGSKPTDVWDIIPEDTQGRKSHFAPYPTDLCRIPILATCPEEGVVLDPFCGTGTTLLAARNLGRKSIGIDICAEYLTHSRERCGSLL